jgi:hypothetical protein
MDIHTLLRQLPDPIKNNQILDVEDPLVLDLAMLLLHTQELQLLFKEERLLTFNGQETITQEDSFDSLGHQLRKVIL